MPNVRIKDQTTDTALTTGDYVIVDSETEGTRKYDLGALAARVEALEQGGSGLSQTEKNLILTLFSKAAYAESDAESAYDALEAMWTTTTRTITYNLSHVSSSNTTASVEQGQSYTTTLTASTNYTLNSVSVTMGGVDVTSTTYSSGTVSIPSVTGNIVIMATAVMAAQSITAVYTQSGTVYNTDSLDSLKADLVVTGTFPDSSTAVIPAADYTLSGNLLVGTSTITVSYSGKTTTFNVTVSTRYVLYDYIHNPTGTNYIETSFVDTGLTYSPSWGVLNVEFEAMNSNTASSAEPMFGSNNGTNSNTSNILWYARANKAGYSAFNLGVAKQLSTAPADTPVICKYFFVDGGQSYMQYDSTTVNVATVSSSSITANGKSLILAGGRAFDSNNKRYGLGKNNAKVGYVKFTNPANDEVLYNFVPAHDVVDDKYGYYDTINNVFYADNSNLYRVGNWS